MWQHLGVAIASTVLAGCSLIYNPNNLPGPPGEAGTDPPPDAPPDAEIILDADPSKLELVEIAPLAIDEGQGDGGSRPALVVIGGHHIVDSNTAVAITADTGTAMLTLGTPVIAKNGNWIAITVTAHVDPALAAGQTRALTVTVTQSLPGGGTAMASLGGKLTLTGYDELDALGKLPMTSGKIDSPMLAKYSKVDLSAVALPKFGGTARAIMTSVSEIKMPDLDLSGTSGGTGAVEGEAGGCGGGGPAASSPCVTIGGGGGESSGLLGIGGGGGGGFAENGVTGGGGGGGAGGTRTGDELIVTYGAFNGLTENRPGGGGGGGPSLALVAGGGGASSGGSLELTAGGNLSVGTINAKGGAGRNSSLAGGGGGGAGGLVMLRAGGMLTSGNIDANGGAGGSGAGSGAGGKGSDGRVRWDAQTGDPPSLTTGGTPTLHRGPSFALTDPVFRITNPMIAVIGTAGDRFDVSVENHGMVATGARVTIPAGNTAMFSPPLQQGLNRVCILLLGGKPMTGEAEKCIDVAFLP
jgi:hypothetical protein